MHAKCQCGFGTYDDKGVGVNDNCRLMNVLMYK